MSHLRPEDSGRMVSQAGRGWIRRNLRWLVVLAILVAVAGCVVIGQMKPRADAKIAAAESSYQAANPPYVPAPPAPVIVVPESVVANPEDASPRPPAPATPAPQR